MVPSLWVILHITSLKLMWSPRWSRALQERRPCGSPGTNWMPQNRWVMCVPFTRHSKDMIPSPSKGVLLPFPSRMLRGTLYSVYEMKSDQLGERWLVHPESMSQLFGSEGSPPALNTDSSVSATYTLGLAVACSVEACSVVACAPISECLAFFLSLYAFLSA